MSRYLSKDKTEWIQCRSVWIDGVTFPSKTEAIKHLLLALPPSPFKCKAIADMVGGKRQHVYAIQKKMTG